MEDLSIKHKDEIFIRQVQYLYRQAAFSTLFMMIVVGITCYSTVDHAENNTWYWYISFCTFGWLRYFIGWRFSKTEINKDNVGLWSTIFSVGCFVLGLHWCAWYLFFFPEESMSHQIFIVFVTAGIAAGATVVYAPVKSTYHYYFVPLIVTLMYKFFSYGDELHISMGIMIVLFAITMLITVKRIYESYRESIVLAFENEDLIENLQVANQQVLDATEAKSLFLANMSHEIRTPMNAIVGFTGLLAKSPLSEKQHNYLDNIQMSGKNLLVIINDILDLSKVEAGKMDVEHIAYDVHKLALNIHATLEHRAKNKGINFDLRIHPMCPKVIFGDPTRMNQVLINLCGNAIKFTEEGSATLELDYVAKDTLTFNVKDTGIGIPKDRLAAIFDLYSQSESDTTRKFGGTGLGLAISQKIVEIFGGELTVDSEYGKGSNFHFTLNIEQGNEGDIEQEEDVSSFDTKWLRNVNILLVDDNKVNRLLAIEVFKSWDKKIDIDTADNGQVAVDKLMKNNYDVILMDMMMPVMNGLEATVHIRTKIEDPIKRDVKIIALTANALKKEEIKCLDAGMNEYMSKPFEPVTLLRKIAKVLEIDVTEAEVVPSTEEENNDLQKGDSTANFDFEYLYDSFGNNEEVIESVLKAIREEVPTQMLELKKAIEAVDYEKIKYNTHSLVNKCIYLNATIYIDVCRQIETVGGEKYPYETPEMLEKFNVMQAEWEEIEKTIMQLQSK